MGGALAAAAIFSKPVAAWIYDSFLRSRIVEYVSGNLDAGISGLTNSTVGLAESVSTLKQSVADSIEGLLGSLGIDTTLLAAPSGESADSVLGVIGEGTASATEAIANTAIAPVVTTVIQILLFLIIFALAMVIIKLLVKLFRGVNDVPVLGGVNKLLGGAFGVAKGAIIVYLIVLGLVFLAGVSNGGWSWLNSEILQSTTVARWFMDFKLPS